MFNQWNLAYVDNLYFLVVLSTDMTRHFPQKRKMVFLDYLQGRPLHPEPSPIGHQREKRGWATFPSSPLELGPKIPHFFSGRKLHVPLSLMILKNFIRFLLPFLTGLDLASLIG